MAELTAHEKFLRGEPLNAELAAVREGRDGQPAPKPVVAERKPFGDPMRELNRAERLDLKEMIEMPGWELFLRISEKAVLYHQKRAIAVSENNPFANRDEIAAHWAYLNSFRRAVVELETIVRAEVAELEKTL